MADDERSGNGAGGEDAAMELQLEPLTEERLRDIIREEVEDVFHAHGFDHSEDDLPPIH